MSERRERRARTMSDPELIAPDYQLLSFLLGRETYALDVLSVQGVERMTEITSIPRMPDFVEGVIDLRGQIVPIIDLRKRFGLPASAPDKATRIIIIEFERKQVGLIVDSVYEVIRIDRKDVKKMTAIGSLPIDSDFLIGVAKHKDKLVIVLNIEKVFTAEEKSTLGIRFGGQQKNGE
ncbi:MAG: chemotaxis protein CheW [bacterium]